MESLNQTYYLRYLGNGDQIILVDHAVIEMGQKKQKQRRHKKLLDEADRCVYCPSTGPFILEHMPPIGMFKDRDRPKGWEFASCVRCNNGTTGVDAVAQMFAMVEPFTINPWKVSKFSKVFSSVRETAPDVVKELMAPRARQDVMLRVNGLLRPSTDLTADGPAVRKHLDLFCEKVAMAAFATFCRRPIRMKGMIFTEWYLNSGMPLEMYHASLGIMPLFGQLRQGTKTSMGQFSINYNTDEKGLIAGVAMFQSSLSMIFFATDDDEYISPLTALLSDLVGPHRPTAQLTTPGLSKLDQLNQLIELE